MFTRRNLIAGSTALLGACAAPRVITPGVGGPAGFVRREGTGFRIDGKPYRFAGANMWYAAFLGADAPPAPYPDPGSDPDGDTLGCR